MYVTTSTVPGVIFHYEQGKPLVVAEMTEAYHRQTMGGNPVSEDDVLDLYHLLGD